MAAAFIWGSAFVAQKEGMTYLGPFTFNGVRMCLGGAVLIPVIFALRKKESISPGAGQKIPGTGFDMSLAGGFCCGVVLFLSSNLQQVGLVYTTAGKAGFITALYIVIVPIFGYLLKKHVSGKVWLCVCIAIIGLYLLCVPESQAINRGDVIMLFSAFGFACHIITIDYFSPKCDPLKIACIQFFVCGILCIPMIVVESPTLQALLLSWLPLLYAGAMSCGVAFTFQVVAQRDTSPVIAALILSFESVFAVLMGFALLSEILTIKEVIGCVLMFAAIVAAQTPEKQKGGIN